MCIARLLQYILYISTKARYWSVSLLKQTKLYLRDWLVITLMIILADLYKKLDWNCDTRIINLGIKVTNKNAVLLAILFTVNYYVKCFD